MPQRSSRCRGQTPTIAEPRHRRTQLRMHPPAHRQKIPETLIHSGSITRKPAESRNIHRVRVRGRRHLRQLLRIPQQQQVTGRTGNRQRIRQRKLSRLINHQKIQRRLLKQGSIRKIPGGTTEYETLPISAARAPLLNRGARPLSPRKIRPLGSPRQFSDPLSREQLALNHRREHILNHRMRLRHHAHPPASSHQRRNHMRTQERLPRTRWALHRHIRRVQRTHRRVHRPHHR